MLVRLICPHCRTDPFGGFGKPCPRCGHTSVNPVLTLKPRFGLLGMLMATGALCVLFGLMKRFGVAEGAGIVVCVASLASIASLVILALLKVGLWVQGLGGANPRAETPSATRSDSA